MQEARIGADDEADRIVARWRERIDAGENVDPEEAIRAHPALADRLRAGLAALRLLDRRFAGSSAEKLIGRALGGWRLDAVLGSGGMGTVYLATDAAQARVAVKLIHPHLFDRPGFIKRFLREAEIGRRIRHDNVVRTLDADEAIDGDERRRFLVMEYVEGRTLRAVLAEDGKLPEALCRHIGREVAGALAAIHAAGAVHRDVKPENVILTADHVVKLMDLGVARLADEAVRLSQTGVFVGSLLYAAPEQLRPSGDVDGRADLHALGLVLYELATGVHPFAHDDFRVVLRRIADEAPRRVGEVDPQITPLFEELLAQLLEKDVRLRPSSAVDVAQILDEGEESAWWRERAKAIRRATHRPLRRMRIPRETALYGRETEIAKLGALFEKAKAGDGQVVLIEGEAGIGKSRLIDEFVSLLHQRGNDVEFLFGSYPPGGAATASGAFSTAYREHFGDDEAALAEALPVTPLLVPAFAALLRGDAAPTGAEPLTKDSIQTVFVHATRSLAAKRTTIVLIEDLHFAPEEGRALFASLALAVPGHRILLVGAARPGLDEKWLAQLASRPQTTQLAVPRLGPKELVHLLRDALKSGRLAEELAGPIAVKSDGNPFFVFELLRGLRDGQFLVQKPDGTWQTTQIVRDIQVPSSIQELVQARVADLSQAERNALDVAACLGFEFDPALVAAVLDVGRIPLLQSLAHVEKAHRLVRSAGRRFVFDHHQVQEALYGGLPEMLREEYHSSIAAAIEVRSGANDKDPKDIDGAVCVDLAEHFLKGGQGARALQYLDAALTHLEKNYLNDAAVRLADRALAVPGLVVGGARADLLQRKAARLGLLGRRDPERAALDEALALADTDGDAALRARARRLLGCLLWSVSQYDEALARLREAQELARAAGDRKTEAAATGNLGNVFVSLSRYGDARESVERHLALAREIGDRQGEATATGNLGVVFLELDRLADAREHTERHLAIAREIGDRQGEIRAMVVLGNVFWKLGRFSEAQMHYEWSLGLVLKIGNRWSESQTAGNIGNLFSALGLLAKSRKHYERHITLALEIGDRRGEAMAKGNLGMIFLELGRLAEARANIEGSYRIAQAIGARSCEAHRLHDLAELAAEEGDATVAEQRLVESLKLHRAIGSRISEAIELLASGLLFAQLGRVDESRVALGEALTIARELSLADVELLATAKLAALPGGDVAAALGALAVHEDRAQLPAAMQARFLVWQATHDRIHLVEAKRRLDFLVEHAPPDCRESMLANVRLHREIAAAAKEAGL